MRIVLRASASLAIVTFPAIAVGSLAAQELEPIESTDQITVYGEVPTDLSGLAAGPEIEGFISAREGNEIEVTGSDGTILEVLVVPATDIRARGGLLGLGRTERGEDSLFNGLPVDVQTVQWDGGLVASRIRFSNNDLETAAMIDRATSQQFAEQGAAIEENAAAAEALRGRVANIDQYNIRATTNVYFDTGQSALSPRARADLCAAASQAEAIDNALLLVVGYTDSTGSQEFNQRLSEERAGRVVNYLQQECGWAPWRMLTPTGMAEADPLADNDTAYGMAQNRRVAVNVLVSKAVEEQ